jgi:PKD repeat protein
MAIAQSPVASLAVFQYHNAALPSMDLTYRYMRPCSDTSVLVANVHNRAPRYTVVWQNGVTGDSIYVTRPGLYMAVLKNPAGTVVERDTINVLPQQDFLPTIEIHRSVTRNNDTLFALPQQSPSSIQYFYKWYRDIWEVAVGNYPMLINPASGTYKVYVRDVSGCGGFSGTVNYRRTENTLPVDFSYQVTACDPQLVKFVGTANTQDSATYRWNFGDGGELINLDVWHRFDAGTYNVTLTVTTASGQTGWITKPLTIQAVDSTTWITNIIQQPNQCGDTVWLTASNNAAGAYYFWNTGAQTKTIAATASGSYIVRVYDTCYNARGYDSVNVIVNAPCIPADSSLSPSALAMTSTASGEATLGANKVKAFPNPSDGQVALQFEKPLQKAVIIKVYDLNGRVMYNRTTTQQLQPLDLAGLPKGYYLIELTGYGEKKVLSLILQ